LASFPKIAVASQRVKRFWKFRFAVINVIIGRDRVTVASKTNLPVDVRYTRTAERVIVKRTRAGTNSLQARTVEFYFELPQQLVEQRAGNVAWDSGKTRKTSRRDQHVRRVPVFGRRVARLRGIFRDGTGRRRIRAVCVRLRVNWSSSRWSTSVTTWGRRRRVFNWTTYWNGDLCNETSAGGKYIIVVVVVVISCPSPARRGEARGGTGSVTA